VSDSTGTLSWSETWSSWDSPGAWDEACAIRPLSSLDELKLGLLSGTLAPESLRRLQVLGGEVAGDTGDARLDAVLAEIRLRVDVELAKTGIR